MALQDNPDGLEVLEGRQVCIALADGTRIDDCQLVSGPKNGVTGLWVYTNGEDEIVPLDEVAEVWEVA
jgi:hypothetical protein